MKLLYGVCIWLLCSLKLAATPAIFGIECTKGSITPLSFLEGVQLEKAHRTLEPPSNLRRDLDSWVQQAFATNPIEKSLYLDKLSEVKSAWSKGVAPFPFQIQEEDILIHQDPSCSYHPLIGIHKNQILFQAAFFQLSLEEQFYSITEFLHLLVSDRTAPVGLRSYHFYFFFKDLHKPLTDQELSNLKIQADIFFIEKAGALFDLRRSISFSASGEVRFAYPLEGAPLLLYGNLCKSSSLRPVHFYTNPTPLASYFPQGFYISNSCELHFAEASYWAEATSYIEIFPPHESGGGIKSIYLKPGTRVKNDVVDLVAGSHPRYLTGLHFQKGNQGEIFSYENAVGKVLWLGNWIEVDKYSPVSHTLFQNSVDILSPKSAIEISWNNQDLLLWGEIATHKTGKILRAELVNSIDIPLQGKNVSAQGGELIFFYEDASIWSFTLKKDIVLKNSEGVPQQYKKGQSLVLDKSSLVIAAKFLDEL